MLSVLMTLLSKPNVKDDKNVRLICCCFVLQVTGVKVERGDPYLRPPSSSLSGYGGLGNDEARSPSSGGGTPGLLSHQPGSNEHTNGSDGHTRVDPVSHIYQYTQVYSTSPQSPN